MYDRLIVPGVLSFLGFATGGTVDYFSADSFLSYSAAIGTTVGITLGSIVEYRDAKLIDKYFSDLKLKRDELNKRMEKRPDLSKKI